MKKLTYMVIEHFRNGDAAPVYERFRDHGRLAPDGLSYVASWVDSTLRHCYQVMETADPTLLEQWMDARKIKYPPVAQKPYKEVGKICQ